MHGMFRQRQFVIATKHGKEKVIAPGLKASFDAESILLPDFDTDLFGTFTGEIERKADPFETARLKCLKAMEISGCDIGIASEGSFGPHPQLFFAPADFEIIYLFDKKNGIEITAQKISTQTNFNASEFSSYAEVLEFAKLAKFPEHGLILRKSKTDKEDIFKDIANFDQLRETTHFLLAKYPSAFIETDMRAMRNPQRMLVIGQTMNELIKKMNTLCPQCHRPGFSITSAEAGLSCSACGMPTKSTLAHVYECSGCQYLEKKLYPNGNEHEDPMYCDFCNP
jgi:hypothetical protein